VLRYTTRTRALTFLALALTALACHAADRPNLVILLGDDSGWGDYNGNTNVSTPNIDSLARSGAVLDRIFVCSACAPTRADFLTGRLSFLDHDVFCNHARE